MCGIGGEADLCGTLNQQYHHPHCVNRLLKSAPRTAQVEPSKEPQAMCAADFAAHVRCARDTQPLNRWCRRLCRRRRCGDRSWSASHRASPSAALRSPKPSACDTTALTTKPCAVLHQHMAYDSRASTPCCGSCDSSGRPDRSCCAWVSLVRDCPFQSACALRPPRQCR